MSIDPLSFMYLKGLPQSKKTFFLLGIFHSPLLRGWYFQYVFICAGVIRNVWTSKPKTLGDAMWHRKFVTSLQGTSICIFTRISLSSLIFPYWLMEFFTRWCPANWQYYSFILVKYQFRYVDFLLWKKLIIKKYNYLSTARYEDESHIWPWKCSAIVPLRKREYKIWLFETS